MLHLGLTPPPNVKKNTMYFFLKLDYYWCTSRKKVFLRSTYRRWNPVAVEILTETISLCLPFCHSFIITFLASSSLMEHPQFQMSWNCQFVVVDGEMGRILIRCNFIWLPSMIKSFHVWNKLAEPHWVGTFINEREFCGRLYQPRL